MVTYDIYEIEWKPVGIPASPMPYDVVYEKCMEYGEWECVASYEDASEAWMEWNRNWSDHSRILVDRDEDWCVMYLMIMERTVRDENGDPIEDYEVDYSVCCFEGE